MVTLARAGPTSSQARAVALQAAPNRQQHGSAPPPPPPRRTYDDMLQHLSGLITFKTRADGKGWRDAFENMPIYLEVRGSEPQQKLATGSSG
jgi:hypothetical protein